MSLRQSVNLPPNYIIDEREKDQKSLSQKWLEQLTERAVDKAFKLQTESRKLVDIVDTHSCGEPRMLGCSFSPLSSKILKTSSSVVTPRSWVLPKNSEERRRISTRIYALLLKWKADFSFEWRARVASVVPVFEEAVYQESKTRENYNNLQLLDSQLKLVLCHFEAGNGPFLLQGITPLYPLKIPPHAGSLVQNSADNTVSASEITAEDEPTSSSQVCIGHVQRIDQLCSSSSKCKPSHALLNTVVSMSDHIDMGMHSRHGSYASKKIVKRVFNALSKKRIEENNRLKQELRRADRKTERMVRMFSKPEFKVPARISDGGEALLNAQSHGGMVRSKSGKKLADILGLDVHVSGVTERQEQSTNVSETTALNEAEIMSISCRALPAMSSPSSTPYGSAPASPLPLSSPSNSQASPLKSCLQSPVSELTSSSSSSSISQQQQSLAKSRLNLATCSDEVESSTHYHVDASTSPLGEPPIVPGISIAADSEPTLDSAAISTMAEPTSTSTSTVDPMSSTSQSRNSTVRVPLSTFLAQRDDSNPLLVMSSYEPGPWDTWEEPTEQLDPLCCVCMVGLKGAGFIPCGHTFCRKCSRELWKSRGTCPLCNRYIREILDIY